MYGPTSLGTIREFVKTGEVKLDDRLVKEGGKEERTVAEALGEKDVKALKEEIAALQEMESNEELESALETAREIRIRHLEAELQNLQKEFDELKQKYLKACETLAKNGR